ncbi:hypothetical protein RRG08_022175 [Elysia crispata]|uniref:Uncharacterized protein n=1 Tax=Elysia crispata TaxID=231223 RepID=A0AAE1AHR7_9GAST|nr:hypothetical protein RRG08_022175 [Elysia crispata]
MQLLPRVRVWGDRYALLGCVGLSSPFCGGLVPAFLINHPQYLTICGLIAVFVYTGVMCGGTRVYIMSGQVCYHLNRFGLARVSEVNGKEEDGDKCLKIEVVLSSATNLFDKRDPST